MFNEDNSGFVFFPFGNRININEGDKTLIYLVAFEVDKKSTLMSNISLNLPGDFVSDDVIDRMTVGHADVLPMVNDNPNESSQSLYDQIYFPNINSDSKDVDRMTSMPFVTSICIGWSNDSYEFKDGTPWKATYRDLTEEGRKLYYSIKKLHNNKEVRILTFNNI